jgi:NAD(P)-dependent dehydrogenase (short-subunit alcohol dehydrogenase family)
MPAGADTRRVRNGELVTERHIQDFTLDFFSLEGRRAIVTGGNRGLGRAFAVALAKAGADLYIPTMAADDGETGRLVEAAGRRCDIVTADLTTPGTPAEVVRDCADRLGGVDIVVNNAGVSVNVDDVRRFDRNAWDPMVAVNLTAAFELSHAVSHVFIEQGSGKIVNVCSLFSFLGGRRSPAYAATKHGLAGLTKAYADELGPFGAQVNGIAPGYFATDLTAETRADPGQNQAVIDHIPAGAWGQAQDLMGTCVFLASRASDYVNGHILAVDGGYLVR